MDVFLGEIRMFGFTFAPTGWALCNGQLMSISQNTALFSLLGTNYGGNGTVTFGLPNLQAAIPISQGQSPGTSYYYVGEDGGAAAVKLDQTTMAAHNHSLNVSARTANSHQPGGELPAVSAGGLQMYNTVQQPTTALDPANAVLPAGTGLPHNNLMPFQVLTFCIALQGIYPARPEARDFTLVVPEPGADLEVQAAPAEGEEAAPDPTLIVFGPEETAE